VDDPSPRQTLIDRVETIQFPHCTSGESHLPGLLPTCLAVAPIQIAVPIPRVSVGVTKIRRKFILPSTQRDPQAHFSNELVPQALGLLAPPVILNPTSLRSGLIGHTVGIPIVQGAVPQANVIGRHVRAENIGTHSSTLSPSHIGLPNNTGSDPGASGAQLSGKLRHHPQPNQHESPSTRACVVCVI
jgi:hypothetical protein